MTLLIKLIILGLLTGVLYRFAFCEEVIKKDTIKNVKDLLATFEIIPYPTKEELKDCELPIDGIEVKEILPVDVNSDFTNFDDLEWLKPLAKKNKIILIGEYHYYQTIYYIRNRIFFALNTFDYYPLISFEGQYSKTPFVDYFCQITDDSEAERYYREVIYEFIYSKEDSLFLEHIRRWNKIHPQKRLHIGFHDMEHDYKSTLRDIIIPYFQLIDSSFNIDLDTLTIIHLERLIVDLKNKLKVAKKRKLMGKYSFITPEYIECVIENLLSGFYAYYYEGAFNYYRQKAIIRNLTDERFLGKYLNKEKIVLYSGGYHTTTQFYYPHGGNFYSEGSYFNFEYKLTKGKTFSILCTGLAYSLGEMVDANIDSLLYKRYTPYGYILDRFQKAYKQKWVSKDEYYLFFKDKLTEFDKLVFKIAYESNHNPFKVEKINWDLLFSIVKDKSKEKYRSLFREKDFLSRYDCLIFVPRSKIIKAKKRR